MLSSKGQMEKHEDSYYIQKVLDGETQYFSYLVEQYQDVVFSIALKVLKNRDDAEEMAQESFIKVYQTLGSYKGTAKFSTWLYRITYNHCISEIRKRKHHYVSTDDVEIGDNSPEMNLDGIPDERRSQVIKQAMDQLGEEDYALILLYYFEEQSVEEISRVTMLTESNTKVKLFRARKKLYQILSQNLKEELYEIL